MRLSSYCPSLPVVIQSCAPFQQWKSDLAHLKATDRRFTQSQVLPPLVNATCELFTRWTCDISRAESAGAAESG